MAAKQLTLLDQPTNPWKLSPATVEAGRRGIAEARRALANHTPKDTR